MEMCEGWRLSHGKYCLLQISMLIPQNKIVRQIVWQFYYVDTAVEGSELYCYNIEADRNSVVSQASCLELSTSLAADCGHTRGLL